MPDVFPVNGFLEKNSSSSDHQRATEMKMEGGDSTLVSMPKRASKSHCEAERRRRQRINTHLSTLRNLLPHTTTMDKASLLAEVVRHVRELRKLADDAAASWGDTWNMVVPGESDEVRVDPDVGDGGGGLMRATVCCSDRPGLSGELNRAVQSVRARPVKAEMATVGGRTKTVLLVEEGDGGGAGPTLYSALRAVLEVTGSERTDSVGESINRRFAWQTGSS